MQIIHDLGILKISENTNENVGFLLTNKKGSYCSIFNTTSSRYQGLFYFEPKKNRMYKFIESIELVDRHNTLSLKNNFYFIERKKKDIIESFTMPKTHNSLIYELSKENEIDLILDCKDSYDNREWGRYYKIDEHEGYLLVKFEKRTNKIEDSKDNELEYTLYLTIKFDTNNYKKNNLWFEKHYSLDELRNSMPFRRYVYNALRLKGTKFVFTVSNNKKSAIKECNYVFKNLKKIRGDGKKYFYTTLKSKSLQKIIKNKKIRNNTKIAYINTLNSLNNLIINDKKRFGLFAGLPWFFQFWSRDSLISLKAISKSDEKIAKKILFGYLNSINDDGRLPNLVGKHKSRSLGNSDSHGWLFLRCKEIMQIRKRYIMSNKIIKSLKKSINLLLKFHTLDLFEVNDKLETWMDTDYENDTRQGARIEIQALRLNMYKLMFELTKNEKYKALENILRLKVREKFWNGQILADGLNDFTIRPNVFITAYTYPELLSYDEWEACFDNSLKNLWLEWGGLSTIDKSNQLFYDTNTGENVKSYHRGDSWFWINNLAAIVLHKVNKIKYKDSIKKIINASTEEILWKGCVGCHSELSSAKNLESQGCFSQAWSNAMYMELIEEVFG